MEGLTALLARMIYVRCVGKSLSRLFRLRHKYEISLNIIKY